MDDEPPVKPYVIIRHGRILMARIAGLKAAGYRLDAIHGTQPDALHFRHPAEYRPLTLQSDGRLLEWGMATERADIAADDEAGFLRFVAGVPKPSWWGRLKWTTISETGYALAFPIFLSVLIVLTKDCGGN